MIAFAIAVQGERHGDILFTLKVESFLCRIAYQKASFVSYLLNENEYYKLK